MKAVSVRRLKKYYQVHEKEPGVLASFTSLFARQYKDVKAVDSISFEIDEGELVGFIGPNGAGKTTALKCLSGLLFPTSGQVQVLGFTPWEKREDFLKEIALVMGQKNQLLWDLPPMETFVLNKEIYEIPEREFKRTLRGLTRLLDVEGVLKIQVRKLSLGQRMKCELIASLLHGPKVLFLDEPTIGLDVVMQKVIRDFIKEYNRRFTSTILLTSHYMGDVAELCRRVIIIDKGKIIFDGALSEIVKRFAPEKILSATFSREFDLKKLDKIGRIEELNFPKVTIAVKREVVSVAAAELLRSFPVDDLNIEEVPIENIIRQVFTRTSKENK